MRLYRNKFDLRIYRRIRLTHSLINNKSHSFERWIVKDIRRSFHPKTFVTWMIFIIYSDTYINTRILVCYK